jgi:menaquinol-cytochrome c reductase cytochrome b/c subunit
VNRREKEAYLREYALLKSKGKPFFPYAVAKDGVMACIVMASIILMSLILGAELGPKADPTTTTYVPRPEWYFFFLFELLRVIKPAILTPLATIGIPTIAMILLFALPFIDRNPERRPERRPIATLAGVLTIFAMAYLTYLGAAAGSPNEVDMEVPAELEQGKIVVAQAGCLACHKIGENGNDGPGPELTHIADKTPKAALRRTLENPTAPMPSYADMPEDQKEALVDFLAYLRSDRVEGGAGAGTSYPSVGGG